MMRVLPRATAVAVILMAGVSGVGLSGQAHSNTARAATRASATCGARVAVLGADMSAGGRFEVQRALKVGSRTVQVNETYQDELAQAGGLIPAPLLGSAKEAVSSALLGPLPAGSGLTVDVNSNIQLDAPRTYANALLTAGVTDAEVRVAAPTSQPALGTTALLGLLRAAQLSCLTISPTRRTLAIREAALSDQLALAQGRTRYSAVPALINTLKGTAVSRRLTTPAALAALVKDAAAAKGLALSVTQRQSLVAYLDNLVTSGTYTDIAARNPQFTSTTSGALRVTLSGAPSAPATRVPTTVTSGPGAAVHSGTVTSVNVAAGLLTVQEANGAHSYHASSPDLSVTRNGETSSLGALKAGDKITLTTVNGVVTAIEARSSSNPATGGATATAVATTSAPATNTAKGWGTAGIAVLAALLLLLLLLLPLIIGLLRRRRERDAVQTTTTATMAKQATQGEDTELLDTEGDVRKSTYVPRRVVRRAGGKNRRR
jgi:uncharacterized protein YpuA (DUF1002 family)